MSTTTSNTEQSEASSIRQQIEDAAWLREREHLIRLKRSTFTEKKALMVKPYFDLAIKTKEDVLVPLKNFQRYKLGTLYKIVSDGFLYLRNKLPVEPARKYHLLKSQIKLEQVTDGVRISFARYTKPAPQQELLEEDSSHRIGENVIIKTQKFLDEGEEGVMAPVATQPQPQPYIPPRRYCEICDDIAKYLEDTSNKNVTEWSNLMLSDEDVRQLTKVFQECGITAVVNHNVVRAMR